MPIPTNAPERITLGWLRTKAGPTVDVSTAARALGIGRTAAYDIIKRGQFPARVIRVGRSVRVVTADLIALLTPAERASA
jgi:predicted DNA-binding transcriptional regulator AlpA